MIAGSRCHEVPGRVVLELTPTREIPRNSEGAFVTLKNGNVAFYYTQYYGGNDDHSAARIAAIESTDGGFTWSAPRVIIGGLNDGGLNVMSVSIVRLPSGRLLLFYVATYHASDARPCLCFSDDDGAVWSEPRVLIKDPGYYVLNNDRVVITRDNRLLMPMNLHAKAGERGVSVWYYSDDGGASWEESVSRGWVCEGRSGLQESGVVELMDGQLLSWARTDLGSQYEFRSSDGGCSWSEPSPGRLISPLSPASIKRLPGSANLLAVYNDHSGRFAFRPGMRTPLVAAISSDGGATWPWRKAIETDISHWYHYTAIHYTESVILLAYNAGNDRMAKFTSPLRFRRIERIWLS